MVYIKCLLKLNQQNVFIIMQVYILKNLKNMVNTHNATNLKKNSYSLRNHGLFFLVKSIYDFFNEIVKSNTY